jgi:hypothetical protein
MCRGRRARIQKKRDFFSFFFLWFKRAKTTQPSIIPSTVK